MDCYQVRLLNVNKNVQCCHILNAICEGFDCDMLIDFHKNDTLNIFLHLVACPKLKNSKSDKYDQFREQYHFKHAQGLSEVSAAGLVAVTDVIRKQSEKEVHRIRTLFYEVKRKKFVDPKKYFMFTLRKRIQHFDPVVSLATDHIKRTAKMANKTKEGITLTTRGYIQSTHSAFYEQRNTRAVPLDEINCDLPLFSEQQSTVQTGQPVQATDGPHENVVFQSSLRHDGVHYEEATIRQRALCRHPEYFEPQLRRQSFGRWPHQHDVQDIDRLVQCGFYFTEMFDMVRCYQCGLGLKDWSYSDDPWLEHVRYSPHCQHLRTALEPSLLEQYRITTTIGHHSRQRTEEAAAFTYRNPEYVSLESRMKTFSKWPSGRVPRPALLAEAGFFYTGFGDQVRCYSCDGGLQHWDTDDDPWIEHARWFSHCQHVRDSRGEVFIEMVQMATQEAEHEVDQDPGMENLIENMSAMTASGATHGLLESDDPVYSPEAQKVIHNLGFSRAAVKMVIQECTEKKIRWNADVLADMLCEKQSKGETLPLDSPRPMSPVGPNIDVSTESGMQAECRRLLSRLKCLMCEKNDSNVLFLPCAHHKMCMGCSSDVQICPICCKEIKQKIRTYMV